MNEAGDACAACASRAWRTFPGALPSVPCCSRSISLMACCRSSRRTAQLIAGIVVFFVGLMIVTNRDYMDPFGTFVGQLVLTAVAVIVAAAVWGMIVLSRPAVPARLLKVAVHPRPVRARP